MRKASLVSALLGAVLVSSIAATAGAQPTKKDDSYGYVFNDDVLHAAENAAGQSRITVIPMGRRDRLAPAHASISSPRC